MFGATFSAAARTNAITTEPTPTTASSTVAMFAGGARVSMRFGRAITANPATARRQPSRATSRELKVVASSAIATTKVLTVASWRVRPTP